MYQIFLKTTAEYDVVLEKTSLSRSNPADTLLLLLTIHHDYFRSNANGIQWNPPVLMLHSIIPRPLR